MSQPTFKTAAEAMAWCDAAPEKHFVYANGKTYSRIWSDSSHKLITTYADHKLGSRTWCGDGAPFPEADAPFYAVPQDVKDLEDWGMR